MLSGADNFAVRGTIQVPGRPLGLRNLRYRDQGRLGSSRHAADAIETTSDPPSVGAGRHRPIADLFTLKHIHTVP